MEQTLQKYSGVSQASVALDLERGDLKVGDAGKPPAVDLGAAIPEPLVEEQGPAGIVAE